MEKLLALSQPELRSIEGGHVYEIWEDGEVTLTKCGSLYGHRNLHMMKMGEPGVNVPLPDKRGPHSCMAIPGLDVEKARRWLFEVHRNRAARD